MLNRIYIVVGIFAIVVLAGAFIAPRFVQWGDYRDRMEILARDVLGADVSIRGDISFSLLPSPRLEFADVVVGDAEAPAATVARVEAEFALMDFLRDIYNVTALNLVEPVVYLTIDENGLLSSGVELSGASSSVALGHARIDNGSLRLEDLRSAETFIARRVTGDLRLSSFSGPFQFQGAADYGDARYALRINSGATDTEGNARVSGFLQETAGAFSVSLEGLMVGGAAPKFEGDLAYRQSPPTSGNADDIRGDLLLESEITLSTDRLTLWGYTLHPDENRAGMRLTGTGSIQLGERRSFDAVVSGGVFSLPPRDATEVSAELPYEVVRLLSELPAPPKPLMPGTLDIDLAEAALRGFSLRELRIDATTDGSSWKIEQAVARLPGEGELRLAGTLTDDSGRAGFQGDLSLRAGRLDALAQLWRRPAEDNPLFNTAGALEGRVMLAGGAFGFNNGRLTLAGETHIVELRVGFAGERRLDLVVKLGAMGVAETASLQALLPEITRDASFLISFPDGSFSVSAETLDVLGLPATDLVAEAQWSPNALRFSRLSAEDWGGVGISSAMRFSGSLTDPHVTGSGQVMVPEATAPALEAIYELAGVPFGWQQSLDAVWPADLQFLLSDAETGSGQVLTLGGDLGGAALDVRAEMGEGLSNLTTAELRLVASLEGDADALVFSALNPGPEPLIGGVGTMLGSLFVEGRGPDGFEGRIALSRAGQSIGYFGDVAVSATGELSGAGTLDLLLDDASGLAGLAGARGASLPGLEASAALSFSGLRDLSVTGISGVSGDTGFGGSIAMQRLGQLPSFSGTITLDALDLSALPQTLFGKEAMIGAGDSLWPEGPLAVNAVARPSRGQISVRADTAKLGGLTLDQAGFAFAWATDSVAINRFEAGLGGGRIGLDLKQCCAGTLTDRVVTGRISLADVDLAALAPADTLFGLSGRLTAGAQFEGSGASLADVVRVLAGEGNFTIADFKAAGLSPSVFPAIAGIEDALDTEADALETLMGLAISQGPFVADEARGAFTIAGGTARIANLIIEGAGGRLAGSLNIALARLGLDGGFVLTPLGFEDDAGLIQPDSARILARIAGTLFAPAVTLDLTEMVAAVQVRANELELERLEALRLQDEARQRAAAAERNRLVEEQRRRAEEEAARKAAEEEARRLELEQQVLPPVEPPPEGEVPLTGPLNLGFQPGVTPTPGTSQPIELIPPN